MRLCAGRAGLPAKFDYFSRAQRGTSRGAGENEVRGRKLDVRSVNPFFHCYGDV
jgi:hypothetical protein